MPGIYALSDKQGTVKTPEGYIKTSSAGDWGTEGTVEISLTGRVFSMFTSENDPDVLRSLINIAEEFKLYPDISSEKRETLSHVILCAKLRLFCGFPPISVKERKAFIYELKEMEKQWQKTLDALSQKENGISRSLYIDEYNALQHRLKAYKSLLITLRRDIEELEAGLSQSFAHFFGEKASSAGVSLTDRDKEHINLAVEIANLSDAKGTIVYNDTSLSLRQQQMLQSLIGTGTPVLAELEARLSCNIKLMSQGGVKDNADTIIISNPDEKLDNFKNTKYFITKQVQIDSSYVAVAPLIAIAKGLLGLESRTEQPKLYAALKSSIRSLSQGLISEEEIEAAIAVYISGNSMFIELPLPTSYDYDQLERLQRQAIIRLIAA